MVKGAVHKKADYVIGNAWTPQFLGEDIDWKKIAEDVIYDWTQTCELRGGPFNWSRCLHLTSICLDRDGDVLCLLVKEPETGLPKLQFLEAHRIGSPNGETEVSEGRYKGRKIISGVVYDEYLRPIAYNILNEQGESFEKKYRFIPVGAAIHCMDPNWFTQGRGIPSISYGILDWYDIAEIRDAEKIAVKVNSSLSLVEKNETGTADMTQKVLRERMGGIAPTQAALQVEELQNGLIRYIKSNGSIESHKSERPNQTWEGFVDHIQRGAFSGMDWPTEIQNMSTVGGAAVRAVVNQAQRSVNNRQAIIEPFALNALLHAVSYFIEAGVIPPNDQWYNWGFTKPAKFSVDVGRDRQNAREDLAAGIISLGDIVGEQGKDEEEHMRERGMTKVRSIQIAEELSEQFGVEVKPTDIYNPDAAMSALQAQNGPQDQANQDETQNDPQGNQSQQQQEGE